MFERFTSRARHAVVLAQEEARRLDHTSIGTEHVLLGLLGEPEAIAGRVLGQLGITLPAARADVEGLVGRGDGAPPGHIPFTPQAKKVLELSLREALALGHNYIGTEHILLGIVREGDVAMAVLAQRGATGPTIRALVEGAVARAGAASAAAAAPEVDSDRRTDGAQAVLAAARQLAGSGPMGSHHLLHAMTLVDDSLASKALAALGVEPEALAATIEELGTAGTSDLSPEEAGAKQMDLRVTDDEVTIVLRDVTSLELGRRLSTSIGNPITAGTDSPLVGVWQANVAALQDLVEHVDPKEDGEPGSRAAIVRAAIRQRLRRRTGGG